MLKFQLGDLVEHETTPGVVLQIVRIIDSPVKDEPYALVTFWGAATDLTTEVQEHLYLHVLKEGASEELSTLCSKLQIANEMLVLALAASK